MTLYRVTGMSAYRGHNPGDFFEASLDELVEARAVRRGCISVVERSKVSLVEGSYRLPGDAADAAEGGQRNADTDTDQGIGRNRP